MTCLSPCHVRTACRNILPRIVTLHYDVQHSVIVTSTRVETNAIATAGCAVEAQRDVSRSAVQKPRQFFSVCYPIRINNMVRCQQRVQRQSAVKFDSHLP
jgi:hypothetical protein